MFARFSFLSIFLFFFCLASFNLNLSKSFMFARFSFLSIFCAQDVLAHFALMSSLSKILRMTPVLAPCGTAILISVRFKCFRLMVCLGTPLLGLSQRTLL